MPSDADALEERSALFHEAKPNSSDNDKTARGDMPLGSWTGRMLWYQIFPPT